MAGTTNKKERILAGNVRTLSLELIHKYLMDESEENAKFRKDLILKLASNILPRKTEVTGEDGEPIQVIVPKAVADAFNIDATNTETGGSDKEQEQVQSSELG